MRKGFLSALALSCLGSASAWAQLPVNVHSPQPHSHQTAPIRYLPETANPDETIIETLPAPTREYHPVPIGSGMAQPNFQIPRTGMPLGDFQPWVESPKEISSKKTITPTAFQSRPRMFTISPRLGLIPRLKGETYEEGTSAELTDQQVIVNEGTQSPYVEEMPITQLPPESIVGDGSWLGGGQGACSGGNCAARDCRWYGSAEYLFWWVREGSVPPLLTTGPLGAPGTQTLVNDLTGVMNNQRQGGRFTVGRWFKRSPTLSLEATYLYLGERNNNFGIASTGNPIYAQPFFNVNTGANDAQFLAVPGAQNGTFEIQELFRLWGAEINLRKEAYRCENYHFDLLLGGRYLQLENDLELTTSTHYLAGPNTGQLVTRSDRFGASNRIFGAQLGLEVEFHKGPWFIDFWNKTIIGNNNQQVDIGGNSVVASPTGSANYNGGLYALPTNIGSFNRDRFVVAPEVGFNVGCQICDFARLSMGYTLLYINHVIRPGDQIDQQVNTTQQVGPNGVTPGLAGPASPSFIFRETDFWAQGINASLEFRY